MKIENLTVHEIDNPQIYLQAPADVMLNFNTSTAQNWDQVLRIEEFKQGDKVNLYIHTQTNKWLLERVDDN